MLLYLGHVTSENNVLRPALKNKPSYSLFETVSTVLPHGCLPADTEIQTTKRELITYSTFETHATIFTEYAVESVVVEDGFAPLLGAETAQKMNLLVVQHQNILQPDHQTPEIIEDSINSLTEE